MTVQPPPPGREPSCEHDSYQPASMCGVCKDGPRLKAWVDGWAHYRASLPHVERPTRLRDGKTYCACGNPWPCTQPSADDTHAAGRDAAARAREAR